MTTDTSSKIATAMLHEEIEALREQLGHHQTVIATLVKRAGGTVHLPEAELETVIGYGITMSYEDDGVLLKASAPEVELPLADAPLVMPQPAYLM